MSASAVNSREECMICLESFTKSRPALVTSCNHKFHQRCIQKWKNGSQCPICETVLTKDAACYVGKKIQTGENTAGTSLEPGSSKPKLHQRKKTSESSSRRSTHNKINTCGGKAGGLKGTKTTYEEEALNYFPEHLFCTTDHPADPFVAQNLSGGKAGGLKGTYEEEELNYFSEDLFCTTDYPSDPLVAQNLSGGKAGGLKGTEGAYEEEELNYFPEDFFCTTDHPSDPLLAQTLSGGKAGGLKGMKDTYEEEESNYFPELDVSTTDQTSEPLGAQNLTEGVVLPSEVTELAERNTDMLLQGAYKHCVRTLKSISTSLSRVTEMRGKMEALNDRVVEKEACISELKEQLESSEARASAAEARVKKVEESAARVCKLRKELKSVEARATTAEAALKNVQEEARVRVAEALTKAIEEFKSSEQYKNALVEYAFSSLNEVYFCNQETGWIRLACVQEYAVLLSLQWVFSDRVEVCVSVTSSKLCQKHLWHLFCIVLI